MDLIIIVIALCAAPYMLARMLKMPSPPTPRTIWQAVVPTIKPALAIVGYVLKRGLAYQWQPEPHEVPSWLRGEGVSSVSLTSSDGNSTDTRTDTRTDPVSALYDAAEQLQLDRSRKAIVYTLVLAGWDVGMIRAALKGANDAIGAEVAEARRQLGIEAPTRTIVARDYIEGKRQEREIAL